MMKPAAIAAGLLLLGGAAYAVTQRRSVAGGTPPAAGGAAWWEPVTDTVSSWWEPVSNSAADLAREVQTRDEAMNTVNAAGAADRNVSAFLETIARAEGTAQRADPYRVCYGYRHTIISLKEHPAVSGEWKGERLSDEMCRAAGFGPGCVSTAAGKYQLIRPTWQALKNRLQLPDFGPASQDRAAIQLLKDSGALGAIEKGQFSFAVAAARKTWASLPGAGYAQPERSLSFLQTAYLNAGGTLA